MVVGTIKDWIPFERRKATRSCAFSLDLNDPANTLYISSPPFVSFSLCYVKEKIFRGIKSPVNEKETPDGGFLCSTFNSSL